MGQENDASNDLLELLSYYSDSWSDLLGRVEGVDTKSILNAITSENDSALRQALTKIDGQIRQQKANVSSETFVGIVDADNDGPADVDGNTEPIPGPLKPSLEVAEGESNDGEETFISETNIESYEETFLGKNADNPGDSARHVTWPTLRAKDGSELPSSIGNYDIHSVLGRGGMGIVYRARQRGLKRDVALKMILAGSHADAETLSRFRAEAEAVAQLQHPNIVQIYDIGEQDGMPYFSLEYIEGETLDDFRKSEPVSESKAAELIETIARAMHFAHDAGIVHRDLKPANILLTKNGEPKVTDFGLVKRIDGEEVDSQTQNGTIMGTPHYMAPEQAWGQTNIGRAADVWAMGAMLYAMVTGRVPFAGASTVDTLVQLREKEPVAPSELVTNLSADMETICLKCLQKDPGKRYTTAQELADDLERYRQGIPILARPVGRIERAWRWCRRKPLVAGLIAALVVALISGTTFSTAFGIKANNSAIAEAKARETAEEKQAYAEKKEAEAKQSEEKAVVNEEKALHQRTVALAAFNTAVEWAGTDLKNVPGTEKFKQRLFSAAVEGLNRLSEIVGDDRRDLALARGYAKAGEGFLELGKAEEAKSQFDESHEILERLAKTESETPEATHQLRIGRSFRNLGLAHRGLSGPAEAISWHRKAIAAKQKALKTHEDPLFVKQEIADSCGDLGRALLESGNAKDASEILAKGAEYRDAWLQAAPDNVQAIQDQAGLRRQIGHVKLGLGEVVAAVENLQKAVERLEPFGTSETASSRDQLNLALFRSDLADALLMMDKNQEAADLYRKSIAAIEIVREKNPTYVPAKKFHAGALYGLNAAESRMGNSAAEHITASIDLRRDLVAGAKSNNEFLRELMIALARGGETEEALKLADAQLKEFSEDGGVLYQVACTYALASLDDDNDEHAVTAVSTLRQAIEKGHDGLMLMAVDPNLESLRGRSDFQALLPSAKSAETEFDGEVEKVVGSR